MQSLVKNNKKRAYNHFEIVEQVGNQRTRKIQQELKQVPEGYFSKNTFCSVTKKS
jgi:hypothetical protein